MIFCFLTDNADNILYVDEDYEEEDYDSEDVSKIITSMIAMFEAFFPIHWKGVDNGYCNLTIIFREVEIMRMGHKIELALEN